MITLNEADAATELIPGDPDAVLTTAVGFGRRADTLGALADVLRNADSDVVWTGKAGDAWDSARRSLVTAFQDAALLDGAAETALRTYSEALDDAQRAARHALWEWADLPPQPEASPSAFDPHEADRVQAHVALMRARQQVNEAGDAAARALRAASGVSAPSVDPLAGVFDFLGQLGQATLDAASEHPDHFLGLIIGAAMMATSGAAEAGGTTLAATGVGAIVGIPIDIAAATTFAAGGAIATTSALQIGTDVGQAFRSNAVMQNESASADSSAMRPKSLTPGGKPDFDDPNVSPGPGWEWKGNGPPGSGKGAWTNKELKESFYPDLNHPPGIDPHYDWKASWGEWYRVFRDGRIEPKSLGKEAGE